MHAILINEKYVAGYDQILILMYAMLFRVLVGLYSCIYVAQKNAKKIAYTSISAAIINITVNLILINKIKIFAASISTLVAFFSMFIIRYIDVNKTVHMRIRKPIIIGKGIRDRVYIVDIICHGSPSPKLWREYAESIQKKDGRITYLTFKDKHNGWKSPTAYVKVNGSERPLKDYVKVFYNRCALRPSCYECPYATTERKTDMTIGDFWHIEETIPDFYDPNGNSLFLIHTDRGEELFEKVRDNLDYRLSNTAQCWQANLEAPTQKSEQRDVFWNDYQKKGIDFVIKKYGTVPMKTKVKNKLLKILRGGVRTK